MLKHNMTPYKHPLTLNTDESVERSKDFFLLMDRRRTVREFSPENISTEIIKNCIRTAGTAPSGANRQPWHFVVVSNPLLKKKIREAAEAEEREFYNGKAPAEWLSALAPLGTNEHKPFLETAPYLIVIFEKKYDETLNHEIVKNYYTKESVGIATGILITALHNAGISTLTHTPAPMKFLNKILERPDSEKPFLILVAGYHAKDCQVPEIERKSLDGIATFR